MPYLSGIIITTKHFIFCSFSAKKINACLEIQQKTIPKFPSSSETQVKFLNMENTSLPVIVEGQEPFVVPGFNVSPHNGTSHLTKQCLKELEKQN